MIPSQTLQSCLCRRCCTCDRCYHSSASCAAMTVGPFLRLFSACVSVVPQVHVTHADRTHIRPPFFVAPLRKTLQYCLLSSLMYVPSIHVVEPHSIPFSCLLKCNHGWSRIGTDVVRCKDLTMPASTNSLNAKNGVLQAATCRRFCREQEHWT